MFLSGLLIVQWTHKLQMDELYEPVVKKTDVVNLVLAGSAYYDIEESEDDWIRVNVERGDLIVIPAGVTHRFTTTPKVTFFCHPFFSSLSIDHRYRITSRFVAFLLLLPSTRIRPNELY